HAETVLEGEGEAPRTLLAETHPCYNDELVLPGYESDPEEAQEIVDELVEENGGPISFEMLASEATNTSFEFFQARLLAIDGLKPSVRVIPGSENNPTLSSGDWDMGVYAIMSRDPVNDLYGQYVTDAPTNFWSYSNKEV